MRCPASVVSSVSDDPAGDGPIRPTLQNCSPASVASSVSDDSVGRWFSAANRAPAIKTRIPEGQRPVPSQPWATHKVQRPSTHKRAEGPIHRRELLAPWSMKPSGDRFFFPKEISTHSSPEPREAPAAPLQTRRRELENDTKSWDPDSHRRHGTKAHSAHVSIGSGTTV